MDNRKETSTEERRELAKLMLGSQVDGWMEGGMDRLRNVVVLYL